jgi:hypothetical protein
MNSANSDAEQKEIEERLAGLGYLGQDSGSVKFRSRNLSASGIDRAKIKIMKETQGK